jgi:hypothetical protein
MKPKNYKYKEQMNHRIIEYRPAVLIVERRKGLLESLIRPTQHNPTR